MAALCETQEALQLSGVVHNKAFCTETHDEDAMSVESPNTSSVETSDTSSVETPDTSSVETPEISSVETPAPDTSSVETPEISSVETPAISSVETQEQLELSGVVNSRAFYTETHDEDAMSVESPNTSSVETSDTSSVETPDTSSVETPEISSVETPAPDTSSVETPEISSVEAQEVLELDGVAHSMVYCNETWSLLVCDCFSFTIEQFSHSPLYGLSLQPQKLLKLYEPYNISSPISVQIASEMDRIFIGCESKIGIYVLDRSSLQLVKKFAENMNRDFNHMVVDETEYPHRCTVYASSTNNDILTKFDYNSGSVMNELSVTAPRNILLKDNKLFLVCRVDSTHHILVIDKHSLDIQSKFALSGWSLVGGICLDVRDNVCVTARNESNHRILYSFDDGGKEVGRVQLDDFDEYTYVLDMVAADYDFIILAQEPEEVFTLRRFQFKF